MPHDSRSFSDPLPRPHPEYQPVSPPPPVGICQWFTAVWKHRWLVACGTTIGLAGAATIHLLNPPLYHSSASLLVRYATGGPPAAPDASQPERADRVILTEIAILTSQDLALQTARQAGALIDPDPENPPAHGSLPEAVSAAILLSNLDVSTGHAGNILRLTLSHPVQNRPKLLLQFLIDCYFARHLEVHRSPAAFEQVAKQAESTSAALKSTESELNQLRASAGLLNLTDATNPLATQRANTQEELLSARTQRAALEAKIASLEEAIPAKTTQGKPGSNPSPDAISEYHSLVELIPFLRKRELELHLKFPPGHRLIALNQSQLSQYESRQRNLLLRFPSLNSDPSRSNPNPQDPQSNLLLDRANLAATNAKITILEHHLREIADEFSSQYAIGNRIDELNRSRDRQQAEFLALDSKLRQARTDLALDPSHLPNITVIESPTDAVMSHNPKTRKWIAAAAVAGFASSLAFAILLETSHNRRIRFPSEIHGQLRLPLMLTIPWIPKKLRQPRLLCLPSPIQKAIPAAASDDLSNKSSPPSHFILPFTHQLRDRLALHFRINHIRHKPKLIGLCGVSSNAGTSTLAAGLAASLADIPDAKVLLVDLASSSPGDSPLFGQLPRLSLHKAIGISQSQPFQTSSQNLFLASPTPANTNSGQANLTPIEWIDLLPELRQSPYDYVVFDLPNADDPSQSLLTARLMDLVLLVLDASTTRHNALIETFSRLQHHGTQISCILNKSRSDLPSCLRPPSLQQLLSSPFADPL